MGGSTGMTGEFIDLHVTLDKQLLRQIDDSSMLFSSLQCAYSITKQ